MTASASPLPTSWREARPVRELEHRRAQLVAAADQADREAPALIAAAEHQLARAETGHREAEGRAFAGGKADLGKTAAAVAAARLALQEARERPARHRAAIATLAGELLVDAARPALEAEHAEFVKRYATLLPKLKTAVDTFLALNDEVGALDAAYAADFDSLNATVRTAWPTSGQQRPGGLAVAGLAPVAFTAWRLHIRAQGW